MLVVYTTAILDHPMVAAILDGSVLTLSTIVGSPGKWLQGYLSKEEPVYRGNDRTSEVSLIYSR